MIIIIKHYLVLFNYVCLHVLLKHGGNIEKEKEITAKSNRDSAIQFFELEGCNQ